MPKATPQKVEPQELALKDKGKGKMVDVANIPSSSTSMTFVPKTSTTAWVIRPKVATQEPTVGKTNPIDKRTHHVKKETAPQEPTSAKEVEPQEPDFPHDNARSEKHHEEDIIKDTKTMLKDLAQSVLATTSQVQIPQAITMSASRYATWIFNALP